MHQSILMNANVDEGSKFGHIGYDAFQRHSHLQIRDLLHVVLEAGCDKRVTRVAAGLAEFLQNVVQGVNAGCECRSCRPFPVAQAVQ